MKKNILIKKIILIILGILTLPIYDKFEDIFGINEYVIASSMVIYAFIFGFILHSLIWGIPGFCLTTLLAIMCNSSVYAYISYKQ